MLLVMFQMTFIEPPEMVPLNRRGSIEPRLKTTDLI